MPTEAEKILTLQSLGENIDVAQVVAISWGSPDGEKYYSTSKVDDIVPFRTVSLRPVEARLLGKAFLPFELSPDISDEEISLQFGDVDLEMQRLFYTHGEGTRVEIFYYYPQVDLLKSRWFGQISSPEGSTYEQFNSKAGSGFMSRLVMLPRRIYADNCPVLFGGKLATQTEINRNHCQYNRHVGGSIGNLDGGVPFTDCPKTFAACTARGMTLYFAGFNVSVAPIVTDNRGNAAASRGNTTNLKRPIRRQYGYKVIRDLDLIAWRREPNVSTPDKGFIAGIWAAGEGVVQSIFDFRVNDGSINVQAVNYRFGGKDQTTTAYAPDVSNFSGTVLVFARLGWLNANQTDATSLKTQLTVHGASEVRVYSDFDTYTTQFTNNRVWCLLDCYTDKRWGSGYDFERFEIADWITTADHQDAYIIFTDPNGVEYPHRRSQFDADLQGRTTQEQIMDICISGRISPPFQHNGKLTIVPFRAFTTEELEDAQVFTDTGEGRNIIVENGVPAISYSKKSDRELINEVKLTFEDSANKDIERPLTFVDEEQQLKAGRAFGDTSVKSIQKTYVALGIRNLNEAVKLGNALLYLGELDSGGIANNLTVNFRTFHTQILGRRKYDPIKIESQLIDIFGFTYFRIMNLKQLANLQVEVTAQAYPQSYYETFETNETPPAPAYEGILPTVGLIPPSFDDIRYQDGFLQIDVSNTLV